MKKSKQVTCPTWMVTMGDCMSLLVTFFVLLLTFSTVKEDQLMELIGVINGALNTVDDLRVTDAHRDVALEPAERMSEEAATDGRYQEHKVAADRTTAVKLDSQELQLRFSRLKARLQSLGFENRMELSEVEAGICIRLAGELLEEDGTLRPEARPALAAFADLAANVSNELRVSLVVDAADLEQHWSRALTVPEQVGRLLVDSYRIRPARISYGVNLEGGAGGMAVEILLLDDIGVYNVGIQDVVRLNTPVW